MFTSIVQMEANGKKMEENVEKMSNKLEGKIEEINKSQSKQIVELQNKLKNQVEESSKTIKQEIVREINEIKQRVEHQPVEIQEFEEDICIQVSNRMHIIVGEENLSILKNLVFTIGYLPYATAEFYMFSAHIVHQQH